MIELTPRQSQSLTIPLEKGEMSCPRLHLEGGIVTVGSIAPGGSQRPQWPIDLGRGASVTYCLGGKESGAYSLTVTSHEREKTARLRVESAELTPATASLLDLAAAEDALAQGDLIRRHWPGAPPAKEAGPSFDRAFQLAQGLGNSALQTLALTQKARWLLFAKGQFEGARLLLEQAVSIGHANHTAEQALAWKTLSTARYDLGAYEGAIEANQQALTLYQQTGDRYWQGIVLGNLSADYAELGQFSDALASAREALDDAKEERDPAGVVYCLSQIANLYAAQGDLEAAFRTYHEGLSWEGRIDYAPLVEAEIRKDLGIFSVKVGDWQQALSALERAIALEGDRQDPVSLEARGALAEVWEHDLRLSSAIREDTQAIAIARTLKLKQNEADLLLKRAALEGTADLRSKNEADVAAAAALAKEIKSVPLAIEALEAEGSSAIPADPGHALRSYQDALKLAESTGEREQRAAALAGTARAQAAQGDLETALTAIDAALAAVEVSRTGLTSRALQSTYMATHRAWYELAVDLCMKLDRRHPIEDYAGRAFLYTERAHARSLLDALNGTGYDVASHTPVALREALARNRRAIEEAQSRLLEATEPNRGTAAGALSAIYREQEGLNAQVLSSDDRLQSLAVSHPVSVASIRQNLLTPQTMLLSYWIGEQAGYRFALTLQGLSVTRLPARAGLQATMLPLEHKLHGRRAEILPGEDVVGYAARQKAWREELDKSLTAAGTLLLKDLPGQVHTLVVVGDGCLESFPFAALRISVSGRQDYAVRRYAFVSEPSASTAVYLRNRPAPEGGWRVAVIADPVLSGLDPRAHQARPQAGAATMPRLTGALQELRLIQAAAPRGAVYSLSGLEANPNAVRDLAMGNFTLWHFATHTVSVAHHPDASGLALSLFDRNGQTQNGVLWSREIYGMHLPLAMVMLSGCETEHGSSSQGEEVDSLARAFFFAGVRSVGATFWAVDDTLTSRFMAGFYQRLLSNGDGIESLRSAQLAMLRNDETNSPAIWAAFALEGWPQASLPAPAITSSAAVAVDAAR